MGYTQYFSKKELTHSQEKWDLFLKDVKAVANTFNLCLPQSIDFIKEGDGMVGTRDSHIRIGDGMGDGNQPEFTKDEICFNGVGDDSHETLHIERDSSSILAGEDRMDSYHREQWYENGSLFGFTKTAHKPYDLLVTATLILYKHHFGDKVSVSGDGGQEGFVEGMVLITNTLNLELGMDDIYPEEE